PWVHLSHGATSTRFSMRVRAVGLGFPRSAQRKLLRAGRTNIGGRTDLHSLSTSVLHVRTLSFPERHSLRRGAAAGESARLAPACLQNRPSASPSLPKPNQCR